ncbi:MAG: hypothetical protein HXX14_09180 [Bacteroidetes bacterium]|nr:hypothetical protein [Bacteroidota bacterium]
MRIREFIGIMISFCALSLVACNKNEDKINEVIPDKFEVVKIQFTPQEKNNFLPIDSKSWSTECYNWGDIKTSFPYKSELKPIDTCVFHTPVEVLPKGCNLQDLITQTPAIDCTPRFVGIDSYYKINFEEKQTKGLDREWAQQVANVSPHSAVKITQWMKGYQLKADYSITMRNTKTGSLYVLHGIWEGTQFVEGFTELTERKLN